MSMTVGSVTVAEDGTVTKSGAASDAYDVIVASLEAAPWSLTLSVAQKGNCAALANAIATAVQHVLTNGRAKIATTDSALQRAGGVDTTGPTGDKLLGLV